MNGELFYFADSIVQLADCANDGSAHKVGRYVRKSIDGLLRNIIALKGSPCMIYKPRHFIERLFERAEGTGREVLLRALQESMAEFARKHGKHQLRGIEYEKFMILRKHRSLFGR